MLIRTRELERKKTTRFCRHESAGVATIGWKFAIKRNLDMEGGGRVAGNEYGSGYLRHPCRRHVLEGHVTPQFGDKVL